MIIHAIISPSNYHLLRNYQLRHFGDEREAAFVGNTHRETKCVFKLFVFWNTKLHTRSTRPHDHSAQRTRTDDQPNCARLTFKQKLTNCQHHELSHKQECRRSKTNGVTRRQLSHFEATNNVEHREPQYRSHSWSPCTRAGWVAGWKERAPQSNFGDSAHDLLGFQEKK